jgi:Holliday junction DNA helicase RuvA
MIVKLTGTLVEKKDNALILDVNGMCYEVLVPASALKRVDEHMDDGRVSLVIYHYMQIGPSSGFPVLVGFLNEIERDFFLQFIKVSGIGPRAAVKALNQPISEISQAIEEGNANYLKTLPGIGIQKAKEIVAKLQGKTGKFGLIQDRSSGPAVSTTKAPDWQQEALEVLLQLQYKRGEAVNMIEKAISNRQDINSAEELLNEIYKQRVK